MEQIQQRQILISRTCAEGHSVPDVTPQYNWRLQRHISHLRTQQNACSNSAVTGPIESHRERSTSATASISSVPRSMSARGTFQISQCVVFLLLLQILQALFHSRCGFLYLANIHPTGNGTTFFWCTRSSFTRLGKSKYFFGSIYCSTSILKYVNTHTYLEGISWFFYIGRN